MIFNSISIIVTKSHSTAFPFLLHFKLLDSLLPALKSIKCSEIEINGVFINYLLKNILQWLDWESLKFLS